ncbi:hypothetical protein GGR57DRAFT_510311 [Xylariaceae sp. FL1272]|nr:hypothetical protein GGR57DRAFT_510311 [Xylariaceae sp. FL1272]
MPSFSRDSVSSDLWLAEAIAADEAARDSSTMPSSKACEDLLCMDTNDLLPEIPALEPTNSGAPAPASVATTTGAATTRSGIRITNPKGEVVDLKDLVEASKKKELEERMLSSAVFVPAVSTTTAAASTSTITITTPSEAVKCLTNEVSFEEAAKKLEKELLAHQGEWETTWSLSTTMKQFIVALNDKFPGSDEQMKHWVEETVIAVDTARGFPYQRKQAELLIKSAKNL